ncbi:Pr6Pr family membrane protein [Pseudomonas edaphica]|uniref:Pr6Pr family membrane protein n=2 Tax=Gammaproteobacteria TaxID=1236 RepID=A0A7Y8E787_9PSED|nr:MULTISPECIES: Pr6Pr family membrane protein [Pseudomonas]NWC44791.1 Pr6Pr family membrane protein [Pseudomonas sp. IPO3747]NWE09337.1 Pr6Pr family membrane protein [Pseudomonas edaphica]NWE84029.1 Pr6Pr family membrane protein [Pseudomonas edaphica]
MKRYVATAALAGWTGLAIQQYLIFYSRWEAGASLLGGLINFFSFFTVLTNTLVVVVLSYALVNRESAAKRFFLAPAVSSGIAASIVVVSLAYNLLLRHLWSPTGFQFIADELLHDVMPLLFVIYWWRCVPKGTLRFKHIGGWVIYPLVYFGYVLLRGHLLGQYQYPFIDVDSLGYPQVFVNAGGILAGFVGIALAVVGLDKILKTPAN